MLKSKLLEVVPRELNRVPGRLCLDSYTTLHGLYTTVLRVLYDSFYDSTILSYWSMENLDYYKDLPAKCLKVLLDVRVDKENLLESSFIRSIYLYTILLVCALLSHTFMWPSVMWHMMWPCHSLCHTMWHISHAINRTENKEKEIEKKIHIDLAVIASQWSELAVHDNYSSRYGSASSFSWSVLKSNPLSTTSTILGVSSCSKYISYNSCHEPPLWLSLFLLFFSLSFSFLFIAWESLSHYVTQDVTMSHQTVTVTSHVTRSHDSAEKWCTDQVVLV